MLSTRCSHLVLIKANNNNNSSDFFSSFVSRRDYQYKYSSQTVPSRILFNSKCFITNSDRLSTDDPVTDRPWQCVEQQDQKQCQDQQDQGSYDVLLIVLPDQMEETLKGVHKPREGCVWSTRKREQNIDIILDFKAEH